MMMNEALDQSNDKALLVLSQNLVYQVKADGDTKALQTELAKATMSDLVNQLQTDKEKKAFWINIYNAFIQISLKKNPEAYKNRSEFFHEKRIDVAGVKLSFSDIEHGILRRSQMEYFLGYVTNPFPGEFEEKMRVNQRDFRIHFALNCGASDCPAIKVYDEDTLNDQLRKSTTNYLKSKSYIENNELHTTALFNWFRGDFGGNKGIKDILTQYGGFDTEKLELKMDDYNWELDLQNFESQD